MKRKKILPEKQIKLTESVLIEGDASRALQMLPAHSIQCVVTSPPYWGMRDYDISSQIGSEDTLEEYISRIVTVFKEVKRVLKKDGLLWLNVGDGYTSGRRAYRAPDRKNIARAMTWRPDTPEGLKSKELIGIPWRIAFALQSAGWYLRSDIIWNKPNPMPESVKDRPTRSHEYLFMFSKEPMYYYDYQSTLEMGTSGMRNRRTVWSIPTERLGGFHKAIFPEELITPCIAASTKFHDFVLDPFFGSGTVGLVCKDVDRNFVGIELNPIYVEYAAKRLEYSHKHIIKSAINY
jgi:site-specific DNA-methyltransferase (cytosine-N4-specific)